MNTAITITPRERRPERGKAWVRLWAKTHTRAKQLKKRTGIPMVEIFDLAITQVVVAGQKREAK